jgi:signal peptidase I
MAWKSKSGKIDKSSIILIVYMIIILVMTGALIKFMSDDSHSVGGYTLRIVVSGSMEPVIKTNSMTIIKTCDISEVNEGDIVCFSYYQDIVHRVIEKNVDEQGNIVLHTKGDANTTADSVEVNSDMLVGKVYKVFNNTANFIDKYSISPGEIDREALSRTIIIGCLIIGLIVYIIALIIEWIVNTINCLRLSNFEKQVDKYLDDIDILISYREVLNDIKNGYRKGDTYNLMSRVKAEISMKDIHRNVKVFRKSIDKSLYIDNIGKELNKNKSKRNSSDIK